MSTEEAKLVTKKYAKKLRDKGLEFKKIYLFGSHAKGKQKNYSDIDIAIVVEDKETENLKKAIDQQVKYSIVAHEVDDRIEAILLGKYEVRKKDASIIGHQVYTTGIQIV